MSIYISITENIYINSIYFAAITCEKTLAGWMNSDQKHIDAGPTRTVLSGLVFLWAQAGLHLRATYMIFN